MQLQRHSEQLDEAHKAKDDNAAAMFEMQLGLVESCQAALESSLLTRHLAEQVPAGLGDALEVALRHVEAAGGGE